MDRDAVLKVADFLGKRGDEENAAWMQLLARDLRNATAAADGGRGEVVGYAYRSPVTGNVIGRVFRTADEVDRILQPTRDAGEKVEVVTLYSAPPAPPAGVDGWKLVPTPMVVDGETLKAIEMMCGGCEPENKFSDGILWIGEAEGDEGEKTYGLHLSSAEYPEEGCLTLVEFPSPTTEGRKP